MGHWALGIGDKGKDLFQILTPCPLVPLSPCPLASPAPSSPLPTPHALLRLHLTANPVLPSDSAIST
jgi:hypothetical protein